jgi:type IX secretion system PorP/SprF family membrane protein
LSGLFQNKSFAQQLPQYSQYMFDKSIINPAFCGTQPFITGSLGHRAAFMQLPGSPVTQVLSAYAPIQTKNLGIGIRAFNDVAGPIKNKAAYLMTSYYIGLGSGRLSLGLELGALNQQINFTDLIRTHVNDAALTFDQQSKTNLDASFGIYYQTSNLFLGWSSYQLLKSKLNLSGNDRSTVNRLWNHNYFILGYNIKAGESIRLEPSVFVKTVKAAPLQYDLNLKIQIKQLISIGCSYRSKDAIVPMIEVLLKDQFKLGLAYDQTLSGLADYSNGGIEVMFTYRKKLLPPAKEKEMHPRYYIY